MYSYYRSVSRHFVRLLNEQSAGAGGRECAPSVRPDKIAPAPPAPAFSLLPPPLNKSLLKWNCIFDFSDEYVAFMYIIMYVYQGQPLHQQLIGAVDSSCCSLTTQDTASLVSLAFKQRFNKLLLSSIIKIISYMKLVYIRIILSLDLCCTCVKLFIFMFICAVRTVLEVTYDIRNT